MKRRNIFWLLTLAVGGSLLTGCMSLASDVTPPPNYSAPQAPAEQPVEVRTVFPIVPPDPAAGGKIYATECMPCHGADGRGDGAMSGNLPEPPPEIGSPELARASRPTDWFSMVTNGNLEKLMPGFKGSLDDRSRWDVVAYVYTLSTSPEELALGKTVYDSDCAGCHAEDGRGNGQDMPDLTNQQRLAQFSGQEIETMLTAGQGKMPAFGEKISASDRWAVVNYVRSLTFSGGESSPSASGETQPQSDIPSPPSTELSTLTIRGQIANPSGGELPEVLTVTLYGFEGMNPSFEQSVEAAAGTYEFKDVTFTQTMAYMVQVDANGYSFTSEILHGADITASEVDLPVSIYGTTTDAAGLTVDRMHVFLDFTVPGKVQVVELFIISNPTEKVVIPPAADQPALTFGLPEGATNLQFEGGGLGERYAAIEGGFGDLSPILPGSGQHQVLYWYELPYQRKLSLSLPVTLSVNSAVVMLPPGGVKLQSSQLQPAGQRAVQGMSFDLFTASNLSAGSSLDLQLSGKVKETDSTTNSFGGIAIGATIFGAVLIGAGLWLFRQRKLQAAEAVEPAVEEPGDESEEAVLDAILALDDQFQGGKLPQEAYTERRAALKERLRIIRGKA